MQAQHIFHDYFFYNKCWNSGLALELPLLKWLEKYTFPAEARFSDVSYANMVYDKCVAATLANGTTTANYFATIHRESSEVLCDIAEQKGQRALIGKVNLW
jgi:guanine deaminase